MLTNRAWAAAPCSIGQHQQRRDGSTLADERAAPLTSPTTRAEKAQEPPWFTWFDRAAPGAVSVVYATAAGTAAPAKTMWRRRASAFASGQTVAAIPIVLRDDSVDEPTETFTVTLSAPDGKLFGYLTNTAITVYDDDGGRRFRSESFESGGLSNYWRTYSTGEGHPGDDQQRAGGGAYHLTLGLFGLCAEQLILTVDGGRQNHAGVWQRSNDASTA